MTGRKRKQTRAWPEAGSAWVGGWVTRSWVGSGPRIVRLSVGHTPPYFCSSIWREANRKNKHTKTNESAQEKESRRDGRKNGRKQQGGKETSRMVSSRGRTRHLRAKGRQGSGLGYIYRPDQGHRSVLRTRHSRLRPPCSVTRRVKPNKQQIKKSRINKHEK